MVVHLQREDMRPVERVVPSPSVEDQLVLGPGQTAGLTGIPGSGLTRIGLSLLQPYAAKGQVACLDVRGWMNPSAAWDLGIAPERLVVVRSNDVVAWGRLVATMLTGLKGVYAEVPVGVRDTVLRNLTAKARANRTPLVFRPVGGALPGGLVHLRLEVHAIAWEGTDAGHGAITTRRAVLVASGKAVRGRQRVIEVQDDGTRDLHVRSEPDEARLGDEFRRPA